MPVGINPAVVAFDYDSIFSAIVCDILYRPILSANHRLTGFRTHIDAGVKISFSFNRSPAPSGGNYRAICARKKS